MMNMIAPFSVEQAANYQIFENLLNQRLLKRLNLRPMSTT